MFIEERHQQILDYIKNKGRIKAVDIQKMFNVSFDTARRDLRLLEQKGLLRRTRGGALANRQIGEGNPENSCVKDIETVYENYYAIAMKAVSMIQDNDVIYITGATVGYIMSKKMPRDIRITAVVNSIIIAEELRKYDNIRVIMIGGELDIRGDCYDAIAVNLIKEIRMDKCFMTSACISLEFGLSIQKSARVSFFNAVLDCSNIAIGLYPTEKIGINSAMKICDCTCLNYLITDWECMDEERDMFNQKGICTIVVKKDEFLYQNLLEP